MRRLRHLFAGEGQEAALLNRDRVALAFLAGGGAIAAALRVRLCLFAFVTGAPCPGCGLCRATLALLGGHPIRAFHFHPLVFVVLPAAVFAFTRATSATPGNRQLDDRATVVGASVLLVLLLGVWIARFAGAFGGPVGI